MPEISSYMNKDIRDKKSYKNLFTQMTLGWVCVLTIQFNYGIDCEIQNIQWTLINKI